MKEHNRSIIISICNHKGGVGKSTMSANLAVYLLEYYNKILVVDMDPQANVSDILCKHDIKTRISDLLKYAVNEHVDFKTSNDKRNILEEMAKKAIVETIYNQKKIGIITSSLDLTKTKIELTARESIANYKIKEMLRYISQSYDLVIIDTPPSIELLTFSSLASSDYIIVPIQMDAHSVKGAMDIIEDIMPKVREYYNTGLQLLGIVINTHESHTKIGKLALPKIQELFERSAFKGCIFDTKISRSVRVGELSLMRTTLDKVSSGSKSDIEFRAIAKEIYKRINKNEQKKNDD